MRVWLALVCVAFALGGCQHYVNLSQQDFDRGHASRYRFSRDNYTCQRNAAFQQAEVGGSDPTGVYNESYSACMERHGYHGSVLPF